MPLQNRAGEASSVKRYLSQYTAGTVLVVGARAHHFPDQLRNHQRVIIWDSMDPDRDKNPVPASVRVIVCLRFMRHQQFAMLQRYAKKNHCLLMPGLNNIGEIKDMLTQALELTPTEPPPPPPEPPPPPPPPLHIEKGLTTRLFVRTYGDRSTSPWNAEARRLHTLATGAGYTFTFAALYQQVAAWHRQTDAQPGAMTQPLRPEPPAPAPPRAEDTFTLAPPAPLRVTDDRRLAGALRLIDDVAAGLTLLREEIQRLSDDENQAQVTITALRQLLNVPPPQRS